MKKCSKCNEVKSYEFFNKAKKCKDGYRGECKSCVKQYKKQYYQENKEQIKEKRKQYNQENKEKRKQYYQENRLKIKEYRKKYNQENREKRNKYQRNRMKTDFLFKMKRYLRSRTSIAFKNKGYSKNTNTQKMLGVEWKIAKAHIERQFKKGMSWSNYGEWHIDHIIPLASANTEEELINLCRYTNLQPLWAEDNLSKGCKIEEIQLKIL